MNEKLISAIQHSVIFFTCIGAWLALIITKNNDPAASQLLIGLAGAAAGSSFQIGSNATAATSPKVLP